MLSRDDIIKADDGSLRFRYFWKPIVTDPVGDGCMSQWYPSPFEVDGVVYPTAEHFMMAGKARLFGDDEVAEEILAASDPAAVKKLGRKVRGFDEATWRAQRCEIVFDGNVAKFSQDPKLLAFLLATEDAVLVEASPLDTIWGIGLGAGNPKASDPRAWRGENLLGFVLMDVRDHLAARGR